MNLNYTILKIFILLLLVLAPALCIHAQQNDTNPKKTKITKTSKSSTDRSQTVLTWISPNPDETGHIFTSDKGLQDIKVKAISNKKLASHDIKVVINNKTLDDSKFGEGSLTKPRKQEHNTYSHTFSGQLKLKKGENVIEIQVVESGNVVKTREITIKYFPERINLHVLSIGPKHSDLQFTSKDAKDFAKAFQNQKDLLFKDVFIHTLAHEDNTGQHEIRVELAEMKQRYHSMVEDKINDKDLLVIFISSHGREINNRFKILTTGYKANLADYHSIDFEEDIINFLKTINCKKLVFIDACNSGSIRDGVGSKEIKDEAMAKALHTLLETNPGLSTFTSCQRHELSYEDAKWKNGAFTKAILSAFKNVPHNGRKPDANGNDILELGELRDYIQQYVPSLVKRDKPNVGSQVPHVVGNELGMDFPIYALSGYKPIRPNDDAQWINLPLPSQEYVSSKPTLPTSTSPAFMDSDGDGLSDQEDHCPNHKGPYKNDGCPEAQPEVYTGPASGNFIDERDRQMYQWVRLKDGKKWMSQNLNYRIKKESWCFDGKKNCKETGRLYTWNASLKVCPKGWRLPTAQDWENLINFYGGPEAAYHALLDKNNGGFAAQLSGIRTSNKTFCCEGEFGNYWSSKSSISKATYADFNSHFGTVNPETHDKNTALSCRCIQE